ncbi:MAG: TIGR00296 family protein [Candidatus Diapherotrites archaeon]|nr:TIGR00296 family protein [Candidatus Diapherotrites archaeon]
MLSLEEGRFLVKTARSAVEEYLKNGEYTPPKTKYENLKLNSGVFVTIKNGNDLRGCIGMIRSARPLINTLCESAINAATGDPRFRPITLEELKDVTFEVSVLTVPKEIPVLHPKEYPVKIRVGIDGLIIQHGAWSGLLLPQVPLEFGWGAEEFLNNLCLKANLPITAWLSEKTKIYSFQAQIFKETKPRGAVIEEIRENNES